MNIAAYKKTTLDNIQYYLKESKTKIESIIHYSLTNKFSEAYKSFYSVNNYERNMKLFLNDIQLKILLHFSVIKNENIFNEMIVLIMRYQEDVNGNPINLLEYLYNITKKDPRYIYIRFVLQIRINLMQAYVDSVEKIYENQSKIEHFESEYNLVLERNHLKKRNYDFIFENKEHYCHPLIKASQLNDNLIRLVLKQEENQQIKVIFYYYYSEFGLNEDNKNIEKIMVILKKGQHLAQNYDYKFYSCYILRKGGVIQDVTQIHSILLGLWYENKQTYDQLITEIKKKVIKHDKLFMYSDIQYCSNKILQEKYSADLIKVKESYVLEIVFLDLFEFLFDLFKIKLELINRLCSHDSIKSFICELNLSHKVIINFDLLAREDKSINGQQIIFSNYFLKNNSGVVNIICDFNYNRDDERQTLNLDSIVTLFHEVPHVLHAMVSSKTVSFCADFLEIEMEMDAMKIPNLWFEPALFDLTIHDFGETYSKNEIDNLSEQVRFTINAVISPTNHTTYNNFEHVKSKKRFWEAGMLFKDTILSVGTSMAFHQHLKNFFLLTKQQESGDELKLDSFIVKKTGNDL